MTHILKIDEMYSNKFTGRVNENANNTEDWYITLKKFYSKNTIYAVKERPFKGRKSWNGEKPGKLTQNINVLVDVSGGFDSHVYEKLFKNIVERCSYFGFSGINAIPFADIVDTKSAVYLSADEIKQNEHDAVLAILDMTRNNNAGGGTNIAEPVDYIMSNIRKNKDSIWLIISDGEFDPNPLKELSNVGNKVMMVVCNTADWLERTGWSEWYNDPKYSKIQKCFVDIDNL